MRLQPHQLRAIRSHEAAGLPASEFIMPPPLPKKKRSNEESVMQRQLIKWWSSNCRHFGVPELLLFSIPNGGARSAITGAIMKAEGARKGVPDLMLAVPRYSLNADRACQHGLFLELKRPAGVVSPEQEAYHLMLRAQSYKVVVCRSFGDAIDQITTYLTV